MVRNSTNPVLVNNDKIKNGEITITEKSDVYIGKFNMTVIP